MRMYDIILKKREGGVLTPEEIHFFISGVTDGSLPEYQTAALLMAIYFNPLTDEEIHCFTNEMANSGDRMDLSQFGLQSVDKHSTGGVGDKTSLIVAPIVATLGGKFAKMSGRGLGHTGGTIDKLESIPGYKTDLSKGDFFDVVEKTGLSIIGQSGNLTPADKKLYALRDVTATVDSIGMIVASIMSKKLAAGSKNIVLDVKVGSGAFIKTKKDALVLARHMVEIGKKNRRNIGAVLTDMDVPLGFNIGNALEVREAIDVLKGRGPEDLKKVSLALSSVLVHFLKNISREEAYEKCEQTIRDGSAFETMKKWIFAQGGDASYIENPEKFPKAKICCAIAAPKAGYIHHMNAEEIGISSALLGAGRTVAGEAIDHSAGIILTKKTGDYVKEGDLMATLYTNKAETLESAKIKFLEAISIRKEKPKVKDLILGYLE